MAADDTAHHAWHQKAEFPGTCSVCEGEAVAAALAEAQAEFERDFPALAALVSNAAKFVRELGEWGDRMAAACIAGFMKAAEDARTPGGAE